jgi:hypothetical protein
MKSISRFSESSQLGNHRKLIGWDAILFNEQGVDNVYSFGWFKFDH